MIRFAKADLLAQADALPLGYIPALLAICVVDGADLLVEQSQLDELNERSRQEVIARHTRDSATVAVLEAICGACEWNIKWVCEHPGCQPCRQRQGGGLKALIGNPAYHCPAGRWMQ